MSDNAQLVLQTVLQTAAALAAVDPKAAAAVALTPVVVQLAQTFEQMQQAKSLTPEALQSWYEAMAKNIQASHNEWAAMNEEKA